MARRQLFYELVFFLLQGLFEPQTSLCTVQETMKEEKILCSKPDLFFLIGAQTAKRDTINRFKRRMHALCQLLSHFHIPIGEYALGVDIVCYWCCCHLFSFSFVCRLYHWRKHQ